MNRWPFQSGWWVFGAIIVLAILPYRRTGIWARMRAGWTFGTLVLALAWWWHAWAAAWAHMKAGGHGVGVLGAWVKVLWPLGVALLLAMRKLGPAPGPPSTTPARLDCAQRLQSVVHTLAVEIGERNVWGRPAALAAAVDYIAAQMIEAGWNVRREEFEVPLVPLEKRAQCVNLVAERTGKDADDWVIVGAHYDTAAGTPGANDNASGVAVMLELMRRSAHWPLQRSLRWVAFANEEPPFFLTRWMGSDVHARRALERSERIVVMFTLETLGFYSDEPGTQRYPIPLLDFWFPRSGNFVGVVGNLGSARTVARAASRLSQATELSVHWVALPAVVTGVAWSDHSPFFRRGVPAFMVTDTALFRYPWYHTANDTPEKLDYVRLASLTDGLESLLRSLVGALAE